MDKAGYTKYEQAVADFFKREGLENLSSGRITCAECGSDLHSTGCCDDQCPECGADVEMMNEPSFSWSGCDCCGSTLGGDLYPASGYNRELNECFEYEICPDCVCYSAYGQLDDQTMMDIDEG